MEIYFQQNPLCIFTLYFFTCDFVCLVRYNQQINHVKTSRKAAPNEVVTYVKTCINKKVKSTGCKLCSSFLFEFGVLFWFINLAVNSFQWFVMAVDKLSQNPVVWKNIFFYFSLLAITLAVLILQSLNITWMKDSTCMFSVLQ